MPTGKATTYGLNVGVMLDIEDKIDLLSPFDVPLQAGGGADGRSALATDTCFEKKVEWLDEILLTPRSTTVGTSTTGDAFITLGSGNRLKFSTGDLLIINSEEVRVTGYATTAETLDVTRAIGGTTAATISSGAIIAGVGRALPEGSDPENPRWIDRTNRFNLTEIFGPEKVQVSGTEQVVRKYGLSNTTEFDHQLANRMKEMAIHIEQAIALGNRFEDTNALTRGMGGLGFFITTNVSTATDLTETVILDQIETAFNAGGNPDRLLLNPRQKRKASAFATGIQIRVERTDNGRGQKVDFFDSDFGRISLLMSRWLRPQDGYLFAREQAVLTTLRPITFEMLAKTGDSVSGQIVGEKTMKFFRELHAVKFGSLQ